jgi:hypothetical protein
MPKHTWSTSVKTDAGSGPTDSIDLYASVEQNIGGNVAGQKGLLVGVASVEEADLVVTVANIVSFFLKSTQNMRVRVNSETSPAQVIELEANKALGWNNASIPQPSSNPLTTNITKLFFYNEGTAAATVIGGFLLTQESQFS